MTQRSILSDRTLAVWSVSTIEKAVCWMHLSFALTLADVTERSRLGSRRRVISELYSSVLTRNSLPSLSARQIVTPLAVTCCNDFRAERSAGDRLFFVVNSMLFDCIYKI